VSVGPVSGAQVGLFNYADDSDASVGLVSVVRHGRTSVEAWGTESGLAFAGVRHGSRLVHNVYGVGAELGGENLWGFVVGLGVRVPLAHWLTLDVDALDYTLQPGTPFERQRQLAVLQPTFGVALTPALDRLVAPTFNVLVTQEMGTTFSPLWDTFRLDNGGSTLVRAWPGLTVGLRLRIADERSAP